MKTQTSSTAQQQSWAIQGRTNAMTPKAMGLAEKHVTQKNLLIALSENQCFGDAIMLLSYAMPHGKGIQWAHGCVKNSCTQADYAQEKQSALDATEKWLDEPNKTNWEEMLPTNTIAKPTSATWLTMAAYWSGGSISNGSTDSENTIIEPAPDILINDSIYSSVMLSVQETGEKNQLNAYSNAINQGIKILYA